jgi:hypothetical protein
MAGLYAPLPTLRRRPRGRLRTDRGRCGSLLLHRSGLSPHTPCQSPGALTHVSGLLGTAVSRQREKGSLLAASPPPFSGGGFAAGAYTFRAGKGSRTGSGLSLARIAFRVRNSEDGGYRPSSDRAGESRGDGLLVSERSSAIMLSDIRVIISSDMHARALGYEPHPRVGEPGGGQWSRSRSACRRPMRRRRS